MICFQVRDHPYNTYEKFLQNINTFYLMIRTRTHHIHLCSAVWLHLIWLLNNQGQR